MEEDLGEIFYQGRMIKLHKMDSQKLENILQELEQEQTTKKEKIKLILDKMRKER